MISLLSEVFMKKIIFSILAVIFLVTGCSNSKLSKLSYDELNTKLSNKETFILYLANDDSKLGEKLESVLSENNLEGYKINISDITSEEKYALETKISYEDACIVFIINGNNPSKLSHITDESITKKDIVKRLVDMNFIKEQKDAS
jgi:PBP1b-binding outer membrane lipoprotein LpoB